VRHPDRKLAHLDCITSLDGAKQRGPRWSTVGMRGRGIASNFAERDTSLELATFGLGIQRNLPFSPSKMALMEKSWKTIEHIRDGRREAAWEAAQALAKLVIETRSVALAAAVLRGGPHALRRALELAEQVIDSVSEAQSKAPRTG
jgi:hypothetical protein